MLSRELNVRYVLEGSVQRGGNRLWVNVQLIGAGTGSHIWAERFDKPFADLFDMQDEIVSRLAGALDAQFVAAEARRTERSPAPDALDLCFQAMAWLYKGITPEHLTQAIPLLQRGLVLDPGNVGLLVVSAAVDTAKAINFFTTDREGQAALLGRAEATLAKAIAMAPDHANAHLYFGPLLNTTDRTPQGIAGYERALMLNRNLAQAHAYIGHGKYLLGRSSETEAHINSALRLSPSDTFAYSWFLYVGLAKFHLGAYDEAIDWLRRSNEANRNYPIAHFTLAAALAHLGRLGEAKMAAAGGLALNPGFSIRSYSAYLPSNNPAFLAGRRRMYDGMRVAGVPEG